MKQGGSGMKGKFRRSQEFLDLLLLSIIVPGDWVPSSHIFTFQNSLARK